MWPSLIWSSLMWSSLGAAVQRGITD
jgi:hypothetical protein